MESSEPPVHFWAGETEYCAHTHTHLDTYTASVCKALLCWVKEEGRAAVNTHLSLAEGAVCIPP